MRSFRRRPSPALVISVIALTFSVAGGAFAAAGTSDKKSDKRIANSVVTNRAPGLSVARATSANPTAFARIAANGTVDAADSKGVTQANVVTGSSSGYSSIGYYCFVGLSPAPRGAQVTVDRLAMPPSPETIADFSLGGPGSLGVTCPAATQLFVDTRNADASGSRPSGFFIAFYH